MKYRREDLCQRVYIFNFFHNTQLTKFYLIIMAKESTILKSGEITSVPGHGIFVVTLDGGGMEVRCTAQKLSNKKIKLMAGDPVDVELSVYDLTKGRIVRRKTVGGGTRPPQQNKNKKFNEFKKKD